MAAGLSFVGMVVMCHGLCGLCGQWLVRADGENGVIQLKNNDER